MRAKPDAHALHDVSSRTPLSGGAPPSITRIVHGRPGPGNRPPLPPGHPDTWGRITAGTCTDGTPYPHPIFDGRGGRPRC